MFIETCEIIAYLQKLIHTERDYATIFTPFDSSHQALSNHPKNKYHYLIFEIKI